MEEIDKNQILKKLGLAKDSIKKTISMLEKDILWTDILHQNSKSINYLDVATRLLVKYHLSHVQINKNSTNEIVKMYRYLN